MSPRVDVGLPAPILDGAKPPRRADAALAAVSPVLIGGRYRVRSLLKEDRGIATFLAEDDRDRSRVVVKTTALTSLSTTAWLRLEHEAAVVSSLQAKGLHPAGPDIHVVVGRDDGIAYLVQPYVEGISLAERLAAGRLSLRDTLLIARELLTTLERVHEQGVVHRDIKPANVIVDPASPPAWAVLIDFSLARSSRLAESIRDIPAGTARFMAPEQAGLIDAEVDQRADLYSVGALVFTCLTGRPLYEGEDAGDVLRAQITAAIPTLASAGVAAPAAVEAMVQRLLRKDPADRYQSAAAVRADLEDIHAALEAGVAEPAVVVGLRDHRRTLTEPAFVGRSAEIALLSGHLEATAVGQGGLVVVEAESGGGKTRLLEELARRADQQGLWILRGQGRDRTGVRPFQLLDGLALALQQPDLAPATAARIRERVGEHAPAVVAALPDLAPLLLPGAGGPHPGLGDLGPETYGEARSLSALPTLLDAVGSPERPALVILDDCQWGDVLTAKLLARWQAGAVSAGSHVLVVVAFRSEEVEPRHPLRALRPDAHVRLAPLDTREVANLVQSMAGPLPVAAVETVARLSEGSPFMASAVLRGMVECGALLGARDAWVLDPDALRSVQASRRAAAFLLRRMDLLSPAALSLLSVGAILGKDFDLSLGVDLARLRAADAVPALAEARARRILWVDEGGSRCVFFHDKLREALLDRLNPQDRADLHRQAAERIEALDASRIFELAYHFDAAGAPERALPYALAAGARARAQYALEVAESQYRIARRSAVGGSLADQRAAAEGLGEVLSLRGSYTEALEHLRAARALAETRLARAQLDWRLGEVEFRCGNVNDALGDLETALGEMGRRAPRARPVLLVALVWELLVQAAHTMFPGLLLSRRRQPLSEEDGLAMRIYSRLAYVHWFRSGRIPCAWAHLRGMNLGQRHPAGAELAQSYSEHAPVMTMIPWYARGIEYAQRSLAIRTELGDQWGQGQSQSFHGVVLYAASDFRGCIDRFRSAIRLLDRTGDRWEANTAAWHIALAHYRLGDLAEAARVAEQTYHRAMEIGDQAAAGISLAAWSRATDGRVPADLLAAELARFQSGATDDAHTATELFVAEAIRLLQAGDAATAAESVRSAARAVKAAGLRQEYVAPVQPWLATALRRQAEGCGPFAPAERAAVLAQASAAARRAVRIARSYRNNLPHALRELALVESMRGKGEAARRHIDESLSVSLGQEAAFEHALSLCARGRMGQALGWPGAQDDALAGEQARAELLSPVVPPPSAAGRGGVVTLSMVDRFTGLLEAGRAIGAAASLPSLRAAVRAAVTHLLRGECTFVELASPAEEGGEPQIADEGSSPASRSLVRQAVTRGRPVTDRLNGSADESLELAGVRSALCAPILVEDRAVSCIYVTHAEVGGLFGPEEERLASFIATLAGAALEHLAGSEARFRSLVEHGSDVITVVDAAGSIQYQSSSLTRIFGYGGTGLLSTPLTDWAHPDDVAEIGPRLRQLVEGASAAGKVECRLRHADGTWRPVEITFSNQLADTAVSGIVLNIRDLSQLHWQETHDGLTGLPNRVLFGERVGEALERARDGMGSPAVISVDLDDFKAVNDLLGHRAGDAVLTAVGKRLRACVQPEDTVARLGSDEFAILLCDAGPDAGEQRAERVADRLLEQMAKPLVFANQEVRVEASVGIARPSGPLNLQTVADLLAGADLAMYGAKDAARGHYRVFEHQMRAVAVERSTIKSELAGALEREEFLLHYQPIVDLVTRTVVGVEPLLRWQHPRRGLLLPGDFLAVAEDSNQMFELGAWVLEVACQQAVRLPPGWGNGRVYMSVNVSGRQVEDPRLVGAVRAALASSGLDPWRLVLEITETAMVHDNDAILARLSELKRLGVRLAVDDFGTGYSSLRYLHRLPLDMIKIDRAFVEAIGDNAEVELLTDTIIRLGHTLGLTTIGEGVETPAQAARLQELGCDLGQGFYYSHPVDAAGLVRFLAAA